MGQVANNLSEPIFSWWMAPPAVVLVAVFPDGTKALGYEYNRVSWGRCHPEPVEIRYATLDEATQLYKQDTAFGEALERDRRAGYTLD